MRYAIALLLLTSCVHVVKEAPASEDEIIVTGARIKPPAETAAEAPPPPPAPAPKKSAPKKSSPKMLALDDESFMTVVGSGGLGAKHEREIVLTAAPTLCPQCPACPSCPGCPACPACPAPPEPEKPKPWWHDTLKVIAGAFGGAFAMRFATFFGWKAEAS